MKDIFGNISWKYFRQIEKLICTGQKFNGKQEVELYYGWGIIFEGKYAFRLNNPAKILLVSSASFSDTDAIVIRDVIFAENSKEHLDFHIRNIDRINSGGIGLLDWFDYFERKIQCA